MDIFTALKLIFISLIPWIELRGSIPIGIGMGLPPLHVFLICTISDILLIPVLILALKIAVPFVLKIDTLNRFYQWNVVGTLNRYEKYKKWEEIGLILFVAIPLPFTGVYSGTFVSYLLQFKKREAFLSIATGAVIAGIIVTSLSVNFLG
ncbi:MAG: small multi-drug export protein [Theionarchaea archaeon]|nr:small multi-drug export protein [Theionarchaea archaeon]